MSGTTIFDVSTQQQLNDAIGTIDAAASGAFTINITGNITEGGTGQPAGIDAIYAAPDVSVTINGNNTALSGNGVDGGLAVIGGKVSIFDLTIEDTLAQGQPGSGSGGGGAGLGGGLFVGSTASVLVGDVSFNTDAAKGGAGGSGGGGGSGGESSLIVPNIGGRGTDGHYGSAGAHGANGYFTQGGVPAGGTQGAVAGDGEPGGTGANGGAGGFGGNGGAGGKGGSGGHGGVGGTNGPFGNGGNAGTGGPGGAGGQGGIGGDGGSGGEGGSGGAGGAALAPAIAGNGATGGRGGHGGDGGYGAGGGAGGAGGRGGGGGGDVAPGGAASNGPTGGDGGAGGLGGVAGAGGLGGGGGGGGNGGDGGDGGRGGGNNLRPGHGGEGGAGGNGGGGGFGGGGGGGGKGGDGGTNGAATAAADSGNDGQGEPGGFGAGAGAGGSQGGAGGGGLGAGGDIFIAEGGTLTVDGGLLAAGTVSGGSSSSQAGGAYGSGIFLQGNETITLAATASSPLIENGVIADQTGSGGKGNTSGTGGIIIAGTGLVELAAANSFFGGITLLSGTLDLAEAGAAGAGAIRFNAGLLEFAPAAVPTVAVQDFAAGDTIEVLGFDATGKSYNGSVLTLDGAGGPLSISLPGANAAALTDPVIGGNTVISEVACFLAGTRILTQHGATDVEHLRIGDLACLAGGGTRPIRWIGRRLLDPARHPAQAAILPVRIARHAFGRNQPHRDLFLSPDHAVFTGGVLIPVRYLINGSSIQQRPAPRRLVYFHVELDRHDVLLAEGLPVESYLETGNRGAFQNANAPLVLHPDFAHYRWEAEGCAPLVIIGPRLEAARRLLSACEPESLLDTNTTRLQC